MGKDAEPCCETCKLFGDTPAVEPVAAAPVLRAAHEDVTIVVAQRGHEIARVKPSSALVNVGRIKGNDVVLPSGTISKRQCQIMFQDGDAIVRDAKSTCGTVVGGRKISAPTKLPEGGLIWVGDYQLRVERG